MPINRALAWQNEVYTQAKTNGSQRDTVQEYRMIINTLRNSNIYVIENQISMSSQCVSGRGIAEVSLS